jgi:HEPN domain-containing protein
MAEPQSYVLTRKALINDFAIRSFRDTADEDYIAARLSFRAGLLYVANWQCQQTIEKYLKCILLFNRIPAKRVRHDLSAAISLIQASEKVDLELTPASLNLIEHLDQVGEFRYLDVSTSNATRNLINLDRAVWEIRRYCTSDPEPRSLKLTQGLVAPRYRISGGMLETVLARKEHPARIGLIWNNGFFLNRARKTAKIRSGITFRNAPLYMHPEILDDLLQYIDLPGKLIKGWREHTAPSGTVPPDE